jgi:autotransporter-associated beta strand protein
MLKIHGLTPNTYSGGTIINSGTLHLGTMVDGISPLCQGTVGTGTVTLNGGTIEFDRVTATNALIANGGMLYSQNGWGVTWSGPITMNATTTFNAGWGLSCSGAISGAGGLTKTGTNTLYLSGTNSFTGANRITAGTLSCTKAAALGTGSLDITNGAKVNLNYTGTRVIAALTFNAGTPLAPGTYGSTASPATNKNDTYFSGAGTVTILPATTTALALTGGSTPADPGTPLTFTATVTGATPTGNVAFYAGTTLLGTSALNGSYQASFTTSSLGIGLYNITAQYAGNATNAASTSAALAIEITSLLAPPPTNLFATPGNNNIGLTWTTSAGATSYYVKRSLASGGPYTVIGNSDVASYVDLTATNGTPYYYVVSALNGAGESANSAQVSAIPAPLPSNTTVTSSLGNAATYGDAVTFTATVAVSGGPATGTVTFKDGTTVLGTGTLDGSGQANYTPGAFAVGSHSITATFAGDVTFGPSVSPGFIYAVSAKPVTITGLAASNKEYDGTATATLTGGTLSGVLGGDPVTVVAGSGTFASANAGTWAVTASGFSLGGGSAGNYLLSAQPTVANASITARPLVLTGTRVYDGTAAATAANLTIMNQVSGDDLTLTGSADLAGKDVGAQALLANSATPVRVQSATGFSSGSSSTSFAVTLSAAPANGNTLVAVISTRGTAADRVTGITSTGATWARVAQSTNSSGSTTEIWSAPVGSGAATGVTIATVAGRCAGVVIEYSGILTASAVDQTAASPGATSISPLTGTTPSTTQANELWIGGIGYRSSTPTLGSILNSFTSVASAQSTSNTPGNNAKVNALERIVSATGTASSGGTLDTSVAWSGAIATFKAASSSSLSLAGSAAGNYTLAGLSGTVTITPKALAVTGLTASTKVYDGTPAAVLAGTAAFLTSEAAGAGSSGDGKPYTVDAVFPGGTAAGTFANPTVGTAKAVTVTGVTVTGSGSGNYTVTQPVGLTANLTARGLAITADNQSKTYGQTLTFSNGSTQFTSSGLQNGETIGSVTLACAGGGAAAEAAGSPYPITPSAATGGTFTAGNYTINYVAGLLTVSAAATTTTLTTSGSPGTYGDPVTLTATVDPTLAGGTVQFHDNAVALGSPVPLDGGQAQLATSTLATGTHSITATYSGSTNYNGSTATAMTQTVTKATPTITTAPTATDLTYGQTLASSTLSGGVGSVAGTFAFTAPTTVPSAGTASHSVTFTPDDMDNYQTAATSVSVTVNAAQSTYQVWAADPAQGLTAGVNDGPMDDPDHDGIFNLLEFVLGGAPMVSSQAILPVLTYTGGVWVFEYERSELSKSSTTQVVEYGSDLTGWTPMTIPLTTNSFVTVTAGATMNHVKATLPNLGGKVFARLKVAQ